MEKFKQIVMFLQGKKTYIIAVLGIATVLAEHYGYLSASTEQQVLLVLGFGTAAAVRAAVAKLVNPPVTQ